MVVRGDDDAGIAIAAGLQPTLRGAQLLQTPILNKGTAFTDAERKAFGLDGLLPPVTETLEQQSVRAYDAFRAYETNEILFYRLLLDHIEEMLPILYTPTVGQACQQFSHIYRRNRGLFVSYPHRDDIRTLLRNRPNREVDVIVVTDGERILGIGDQGAGGMGIPIGKLSLYTLVGGIHPARTLPVILDVGTNNSERRDDPEYVGWRHERVSGQAYLDFVERFVQAVQAELPTTLLQWEDFATPHARPILERYRDQLLTFNDDIQGTAAVTLGAILGAVSVTGRRLTEQQVVFLGAGSAAVGVADYLRAAMVQDGLSEPEARGRFWLVDKDGLLHTDRGDLSPEQRVYAQPTDRVTDWPRTSDGKSGLADVIGQIEATILIGLSTVGGAFTEPIVREMARKVTRPVIFPLSNPTARSEAKPQDLIRWTGGRALIATGSPFAPADFDGRIIPIAQCNNVFIFPAVGLGVIACGARRVTDGMMLAAARALGENSPARNHASGSLLPAVHDLRTVAVEIATAVGQEAQRAGVAPNTSAEELRARIVGSQWMPEYLQPANGAQAES
jgi:malate dehydrogenase (oxaloacetate-decarboxylating)